LFDDSIDGASNDLPIAIKESLDDNGENEFRMAKTMELLAVSTYQMM